MVRWRLWTAFSILPIISDFVAIIDFWSVPESIWAIFEGHRSKPSQDIFLLNITENQFVLDFLCGPSQLPNQFEKIWVNLHFLVL